MKLKLLLLTVTLVIIFGIAGIVYAANGDLVVTGNIAAGTGITFTDGSKQTTAVSRLVCDQPVPTATTTVTCTGLNGLNDGAYEFEFTVVNGVAGQVNYRLYYNDERTPSNYQSVIYANHIGTAAVYNAGYADGQILDLGSSDDGVVTGSIILRSNLKVRTIFDALRTTGPYIQRSVGAQFKNAALASNLTRIDVVANVNNGIGAGSRIRVWKKN